MFRRILPGISILSACILSVGLQLPTHVGSGAFFGVFGAEILPVLDPICNAVAPKKRNCTDFGPNCLLMEYIAGPQTAEAGGVNSLRFDKNGSWLDCRDFKKGGLNPPCKKIELFEDKGKCTPTLVTLE